MLKDAEVQVNCPPLCLSFWIELAGACNSIWYQGQRSRVRILAGAIEKNYFRRLLFPGLRLGGAYT